MIEVLRSASNLYREKLIKVPGIIADWLSPYGGVTDREILEFGCGEGTMALGMALGYSPARVVGAEILDVYRSCAALAKTNLGLNALPENLRLTQIAPGQSLELLGRFDFVYSWSVFEHVHQDLLLTAMRTIHQALKPRGVFLLQISPLYYSAFGSHLEPWVPEAWAHLAMQADTYRDRFMRAPDTPADVRHAWAVYVSEDAPRQQERAAIWETFKTLNRATAPQLQRLAEEVGFELVRDYRTARDYPIPDYLSEIYDRDVLLTEQIVWLFQRSD